MGGPNERGLFNGHPIEWNKKRVQNLTGLWIPLLVTYFSNYLNSFIIKCILMIFCTNSIDGNIFLITNQHFSSHDICILDNVMLGVSDY